MKTELLALFRCWHQASATFPMNHPVELTLHQSYQEWLLKYPDGYIDAD
jgi:hypothetical protein